jgi:hypothetical protein
MPGIRYVLVDTLTHSKMDIVCIQLLKTTQITAYNIDLSENRVGIYIDNPLKESVPFSFHPKARTTRM